VQVSDGSNAHGWRSSVHTFELASKGQLFLGGSSGYLGLRPAPAGNRVARSKALREMSSLHEATVIEGSHPIRSCLVAVGNDHERVENRLPISFGSTNSLGEQNQTIELELDLLGLCH
jgi:hypothetical protein